MPVQPTSYDPDEAAPKTLHHNQPPGFMEGKLNDIFNIDKLYMVHMYIELVK
jgi:hypothetical protein